MCVFLCRFRNWFVTSMEGVRKHLLRKSQPDKLVFIGEERDTGQFYPKMVGGPEASSFPDFVHQFRSILPVPTPLQHTA